MLLQGRVVAVTRCWHSGLISGGGWFQALGVLTLRGVSRWHRSRSGLQPHCGFTTSGFFMVFGDLPEFRQ